jgi:hypothetical protein
MTGSLVSPRTHRPFRLYVTNKFRGQPLPVRQHRWQARGERAHFACQRDLTLSVQDISDGPPPGNDRLSGLGELMGRGRLQFL